MKAIVDAKSVHKLDKFTKFKESPHHYYTAPSPHHYYTAPSPHHYYTAPSPRHYYKSWISSQRFKESDCRSTTFRRACRRRAPTTPDPVASKARPTRGPFRCLPPQPAPSPSARAGEFLKKKYRAVKENSNYRECPKCNHLQVPLPP